MPPAKTPHSRPTFRRYGGNYQLVIQSLDDLRHLPDLVDSRWMATSCPLFGLRIDPAFLTLLDSETNGRILSDEVRLAVTWLLERLRPDDSWTRGEDQLPLALFAADDPNGKALLDTAQEALAALDSPEAADISLAQVRAYRQRLRQSHFNGDGIVHPAACPDAEAAAFAQKLLDAYGGTADINGTKGIDAASLDRFGKEAAAYLAWLAKGPDLIAASPWGEQTPQAAQAVAPLRDKVEDFFAQCLLARLAPSTPAEPFLDAEERARLADAPHADVLEHLRRAPLAPPAADGRLPLDGESPNPLHRAALGTLRDQAVAPLFGDETRHLDRDQWDQLAAALSPYLAWRTAKPDTPLEKLDPALLQAGIERHVATLRLLIADDSAAATHIKRVDALEKLLLLHQWLFVFVNNFASFPYLFQPDSRALFEMGRLVLEGRRFEFCVQVENLAQHAELARNSGIFLLYAQLSGPRPEDNIHIAAPVTRGPTQGYYVGRRGVFFTIEGRELDATVVRIVENPVSFWESMKAPLRYVQGVASRRFEQLGGSVQKEAESQVGKAGTEVEGSLQEGLRQPAAPPQAAPPPSSGAGTRDLMIGFGLLAAGLGTAVKFLADTARQLTNPQTLWMVLAILSVFVATIVLLTCLSAWLKLRRRDLGGLLQASGWAVNCRLRLTWRKARFLTRKMGLPKGARRRFGLPPRKS